MRKRRRTTIPRKRRKNPLVFIILLVVILVVGFLVFKVVTGNETQGVNTPEPQQQVSTQEEPKEKKKDDWQLTLVNQDNKLPENYSFKLETLDSGYQVDARIVPELNKMLAAAKKEGLSMIICSAYRSVETQTELFDEQVEGHMDEGLSEKEAIAKAKTAVAYPGTSEHNMGLALDIVSLDYQMLDDDQADTDEAKWLAANSYKYGFILRYPKDKEKITGVIFEPWHFRYVGVESATEMTKNKVTLEEYVKQ